MNLLIISIASVVVLVVEESKLDGSPRGGKVIGVGARQIILLCLCFWCALERKIYLLIMIGSVVSSVVVPGSIEVVGVSNGGKVIGPLVGKFVSVVVMSSSVVVVGSSVVVVGSSVVVVVGSSV